ncbi:MAG: hypothetical protein JXA21_27515 [Anaerolineae bacterium]|nr:hypothetical protein [Anaerolineae bacterium]
MIFAVVVAEAGAQIGNQVCAIPRRAGDGERSQGQAGVGVVERVVVGVGVTILSGGFCRRDRIAALRDQAVGLGELA